MQNKEALSWFSVSIVLSKLGIFVNLFFNWKALMNIELNIFLELGKAGSRTAEQDNTGKEEGSDD